jgi:hypothetical protein
MVAAERRSRVPGRESEESRRKEEKSDEKRNGDEYRRPKAEEKTTENSEQTSTLCVCRAQPYDFELQNITSNLQGCEKYILVISNVQFVRFGRR